MLTFYYDTNSPFAYLAAGRVDEVLPEAEWRPIVFGAVLKHHQRVPWSLQEGREEGMAEVERRAAERGLPPVRWPEGWPLATYSLAPLRALVVAERHDALRPLTRELYTTQFVEGLPQSDLDNVLAAAGRAGLDPEEVRTGIERQDVKDLLRERTDEAIARGVVGVPTVAVGDELFWGDDRLEDAAAAASAV